MSATPIADPISPAQRILTLDVLRGFALFGILFVNVGGLVSPADWFDVDWAKLSTINYNIELFKLYFTQGKFYTIFALLFGLGFSIQLARAERAGGHFALRFLWRVTLLLGIGIIHMILIWDGDILHSYAIGGMILLGCYLLKHMINLGLHRLLKTPSKMPRELILLLATLLILGPIYQLGAMTNKQVKVIEASQTGEVLTPDQSSVLAQINQRNSPDGIQQRRDQYAETNTLFATGSYLDALEHRFESATHRIAFSPFWLIISGLFLIGTYFGRYNFIGRAAQLQNGFRLLFIGGIVVGIPLNWLFLSASIATPEQSGIYWAWIVNLAKTLGGLAFALAYIALITLAMLGPAQRWLRHFAPVGQMALTNYLLQSVIGTAIFYGHGFGLVGKVDALTQLGYIVILFALQMLFSHWWLTRYRFGPVEWLWRSLTYWRRQPMRISDQ